MSVDSEPFLGRPDARIMLLGMFHFQDRGLDWYKPQIDFDVFSEERQGEIADVVELLAAFQATKIAVERTQDQQHEIDLDYLEHLRGEYRLPADEVYQLGFRLAKRLGHDRVWCVNAWDRHYEALPRHLAIPVAQASLHGVLPSSGLMGLRGSWVLSGTDYGIHHKCSLTSGGRRG